ncbi:general stress protein [Domibacillus indicus]|uniref:general stress protein n=1 Tax=Domibacillus indicus TaxID=1437523 RepID=UPI000696A5BF|nr:general stress protein [Domibacillus indicus]
MAVVQEYNTVNEAVRAANSLYTQGIAEEEVYVLAHDAETTNAVADQSNAEKIGMDETGVGATVKNMFRSKGDQLRSKMEEIGLSAAEADTYEERLDQGKILLISKNDGAAF